MNDHAVSFERLAAQLDATLQSEDLVRKALSKTPYVLAGYGSIARPMCGGLAARGAQRMTLVDPKSYVERSVATQCEPQEVGRPKVDVGAEQLARFGASVNAFLGDLYDMPDGLVDSETIVVASVDNRRGDMGANRLAARMGARLLKVNVEPEQGTAAVRAFDFRQSVSVCAECQFNDRHYNTQRHPRSCDGAADGRRTNSPRWLSQAAANLGLLAAIDLALDSNAAGRWTNCEWQQRVEPARVERSILSANANCRWDHAQRWPAVERIAQGPSSVTLADLFGTRIADFDSSARIRFCQSVALSGACGQCGRQARLIRWTNNSDPRASIAGCRHCGGEVMAPGYWKFSELAPRQLAPVWDQPLADWGVGPYAVLSLQSDESPLQRHNRRCSFVINK